MILQVHNDPDEIFAVGGAVTTIGERLIYATDCLENEKCIVQTIDA
jgi:hypothetical protein